MLREAKNAGYVRRGMWFWTRYLFTARNVQAARGITPRLYELGRSAQEDDAVPVLTAPPRQYWWCGDRFWWEDEGLTADDVFALVYERDRRKQRKLEHAHAVLAAGEPPVQRRQPIPVDVREAVFRRDRGRCVECGSDFDIQYDHVIPVAMGGANTVQNLQILCAPCNQRKGARLG